MEDTKIKRLSMNVPLRVHEHIKKRANNRHMTITRWVLWCVIEQIIREEYEIADK